MGPGDHDGHDICGCGSNGALQLVSRPLIAQKTGPVMEDQPTRRNNGRRNRSASANPQQLELAQARKGRIQRSRWIRRNRGSRQDLGRSTASIPESITEQQGPRTGVCRNNAYSSLCLPTKRTKMLTETITFTNFDGKKVTETHYFNLTRAELVKWEMEKAEGVGEHFLRLSQAGDKVGLGQAFHDFLRRTYGLKSEDGNRHMKSEAIANDFEASAAFDEFYMKLISDDEFALKFIKGVLPQEWVTDEMIDQVMQTQDDKLRSVTTQIASSPMPPPPPIPNEAIARGQRIVNEAGM